MLKLAPVEEQPKPVVIAEHSSERFLCCKEGKAYFWQWLGDKERVLVTGPHHKDLWESHRLLLEAMADTVSSGRMSQFGVEEGVRDCA